MTYAERMVIWKLPELLKAHGISAYKLAAELGGKVNRNSAFKIAKGDTDRVDRTTLNHLIETLRRLTGNPDLDVGDLLSYAPDPQEVPDAD